ncbi:HNH endonuclease [Tranquillimonas alkanivorans]|uniref:HNH endonuclease n=1 Tax=Tranquillimonas alkanivorans TaxID=441119 RepID=A0A1I5PMA6_9RHOB|nr:HNH endonuclease signature motif containing protein [Tranquillimonas alkanivorans]SFP35252.1 HNH endonuclease [Tranquillimonas alkanivorans]
MGLRYDRHGAAVYRDKRWPALRMAAKRRDGWRCVQCGSRHRLEVDHVLPVRENPGLAFDLGNLQTLCGSCHGRKTRLECGHPPLSDDRQKWRDLVLDTHRQPIKQEGTNDA